MTGKIYYKILSVVASISLLLNSLWGIFLYPQTVFAEEATESAELELIEEVVPTPEPSPTPLPTPDLDEIEQVELPESLPEELEESPTVEESASLVVSLWIENEDGSVITSSTVGEGVEYYYKDTQVKVVFTKLAEPGYLTIREFEPEDAEELGILGKAYEITSDMQNGTFLYDLTLPLPEEAGDNFEIKYAENGDSLDNAQVVEELKEENENTVMIQGLDHFTVFVVTNPPALTGQICIDAGATTGTDCYATIQEAINAASDGDTINVADGIYTITSRITVNKSNITITGNTTNPENVIVQYSPATNDLIFDMRASDVTIEGIKTTGGKSGFWFNQAAVTGCTISHSIIDNVNEYGIYMKNGGSGHTIEHNTISNTGQTYAGAPAILIEDSLNITVNSNTLSSISDKGIYVRVCTATSEAERVKIANNILSGCGYSCIQVYKSPYTVVDGNTISSTNDKGINIIGPNANSLAERLEVTNNIISGCPWGGMLVTHDKYTYIHGNTVGPTGDKGITIGNGENVTNSNERIEVSDNTVTETKYPGIQIAWSVPYTYIYNNTLTKSNYYGGDGTGDWDYASIHIDENCPNTIVDSNTVSDGINGIQTWANNTTITNNTIYDMGLTYADTKITGDGIYYNSGIIIGTNWLTNNLKPTGTQIADNSIYSNYRGLYVRDYVTLSPSDSSVLSVTAKNNWWGYSSGPYDEWSDGSTPLTNLAGEGNAVSGPVDYSEWAVNSDFTFDAPINLGWNIRSKSPSNPGERSVDFVCSEVTNADFDIHGNGKISQNWELVDTPTNVKYQRQYMWPGSGNWSTDGTAYTNTYIPFSTFGSSTGTEGEWNSRVRAWVDVNSNNSLDEGIDTISEWSNQCSIIYDRTAPVTTKPLDSPEDGSFWNTPVQIQGVSTDNFWTELLNLFYKQTGSSDPWTFIDDMANSDGDAVFDWGPYLWTPDTEGTYDIMAAAVDAAGNKEKSVYVYSVTFDNTQPTITNVSADKDYVKAGDELTITAEVTDASGISAVSADFSYDAGYINRPSPTSVAMQNIGGTTYKTIYTVPSGWDEGIMYIKVAARDGTGGNWIRSNDQDTVIVDNTAPLITFEIPENGSTHAGTISLKAVCDEDCNYINFWWRAESEPYSSSSKRYHYVHSDGTIFEWDLNSLNAEKWDGDTYVMNDGTYYLYAAGKDLAGNWARTPNVQIVVDNTAPLVTIESPLDFSLLRGTVDVMGTLSEDVELSHYNFSIYPGGADFNDFSLRLYSDTQYLSTSFTNQLLYEWDTTTWADGDYLLRFAARDKVGNRDMSGNAYLGGDDSQHVVRVTVDNTPPTITWTSPTEGAVISGTTVVLTEADDNLSGVKSVIYYYQKEGEPTWYTLDIKTNSPYETSWDTTGLTLGDYNLKAVATDNAGNSIVIERSVGIAAVISGETWSRPDFGEITISWNTDRPTDGRVVYDTVSHSIDSSHPNYGYASTSGTVDTSPKSTSHTVTLSGLSNSTTYYWRTVSGGSPKVISVESRGDTFSIPGGGSGDGGAVSGLATSVTTTTAPFPYAEFEDTSTPEDDSEEVLGEETEVVTEEPETPLDEAVGILSKTAKGRILAISAFLLGLILYFISRRRRQ